jgi:Cu/Zn superoxide dismutase
MRRVLAPLVLSTVALAPAACVRPTALVASPLTDLRPDADDPTDGATGAAFALAGKQSTVVSLSVHGIDAEAGRTFGAHVHTGPCVAGEGTAAGPHYAHDTPPSPDTEIWLDLTVDRSGSAMASAVVPFVVPPGAAHSIVVHERPTAPDGTAGGRLACLPVTL